MNLKTLEVYSIKKIEDFLKFLKLKIIENYCNVWHATLAYVSNGLIFSTSDFTKPACEI